MGASAIRAERASVHDSELLDFVNQFPGRVAGSHAPIGSPWRTGGGGRDQFARLHELDQLLEWHTFT
jgi:hypothetical protein